MWAYNLLSLANPHAALGATAHFQQLHGRLSASHSECLHRLIYHYPLAECNLNCNQFWLISNQSQCWVEQRVGIARGSRRVGYWFAVNARAVAGHKTRANWQRATGNRANGRQANLMHWQLGSAWRAETTATTAAARRPHNQFERSSPSLIHCPFCGKCTLRGSHLSRLFVIYLPWPGVTWPMQFSQASILLNIQQNVAKINCQRSKSCIQRPPSALSVFTDFEHFKNLIATFWVLQLFYRVSASRCHYRTAYIQHLFTFVFDFFLQMFLISRRVGGAR